MNDHVEPSVPVAAHELAELTAALASGDPRNAVLRVVERLSTARMQTVVFSASRCFLGSMELERVYSSRPDLYPVGARKTKRETGWAQQVMRDHEVFVGEGALEMAAAFDDQEQMARAGVRSIINVPIVVDRACVAVLAFARHAERVAPADVLLAKLFGIAATAPFVHASR